MTSSWLFMTFLNPCYVSLTQNQILHLHFLDLCAKPVGGKLTYMLINSGFEAAFHTLSLWGFFFFFSCVCVRDGLCRMISSLLVWLSATCSVSEKQISMRTKIQIHTHAHTHTHLQHAHTGAVSPTSYPPLLPLSFSGCQLQLGGLPDCAACLSTRALPLCSLARSVSVLLGQMTHTIMGRFIKEVQ